jgi:hypothetical protein
MIDVAVEFYFWTEQHLNGTELLGLRLTETLEVPNTIMVGNPLIFPVIYNTAPNGQRFTSYGCQKLNRFAESEILDRPYLSAQVRFFTNFLHDLSRNFEYKICH